MKELNRTDRLTIASLIILFIMVIGFLTIRMPDVQFERNLEESASHIMKGPDIILTGDAAQTTLPVNNDYYWIDLGSPDDYRRSHPANAVNMAIQDILEPENIKLFKKLRAENRTIVFTGPDQLQVNAAWTLLKQLSFDNITVAMPSDDYLPKYNYKAVLDSLSINPVNTREEKISEPVRLIRKEKKAKAEGGC